MVTISHFTQRVAVVRRFLANDATNELLSILELREAKELWLLKKGAVSPGPFDALSFRPGHPRKHKVTVDCSSLLRTTKIHVSFLRDTFLVSMEPVTQRVDPNEIRNNETMQAKE